MGAWKQCEVPRQIPVLSGDIAPDTLFGGARNGFELRVARCHLPEGALDLGARTGPLALGEALDRLEHAMLDEEPPFDRQGREQRDQPLVVDARPHALERGALGVEAEAGTRALGGEALAERRGRRGVHRAVSDHDAVLLLRLRGGDEAAPHVLEHPLGLALEGAAPAARTRRGDSDDVAGLHGHHVRVAEIDLVIATGVEEELRGFSRVAAAAAPGREVATVTVPRGDHRVGRGYLELECRPRAAAIAAGAAGVRLEAVAEDLHGYLGLVDLDGRVLEEAEIGAGALGAIAEGGAAAAAGDWVQVRHQPSAGAAVGGAQ